MGWEDMCCGAGIVVFGGLCVLCAGSVSLVAYRIYATIRDINRDYERLCGRVYKLEEHNAATCTEADAVEDVASEEVEP